MIWDFCPDMMHIIKTFFERLALGVFSGSRRPKFSSTQPTKPARGATHAERKQFSDLNKKYNQDKREHAREVTASDECQFSVADQKIVDERDQNLVGYPYWIRTSLVQSRTMHDTHTNKLRIPS